MFSPEVAANVFLMLLCYLYILLMIVVSSKMSYVLHISKKISRKFLHAVIGNLPFVIPFFTASIYPALVAAPFILVTFIATPVSPFKGINKKLGGLANLTEEGHHLGLFFYAISYTVLALFFGSQPHIIAAGILPMAYGDSAAHLVGEKYGKTTYKLAASKSIEGSAAMFAVSFFTVILGIAYFSLLYGFPFLGLVAPAVGVASITTLVEAFSPRGLDNLTVPTCGALAFLLLTGGA